MVAEQKINLTLEILGDCKRYPWHLVMLVLLLCSAFAIIIVTNGTRQLVIEQNELLDHQDQLDHEWRHLVLEQSALAEHSRIGSIARNKLDMLRPSPKDERIITP